MLPEGFRKRLPGIGEEDVAVPKAFYKIVARGWNPKDRRFLIPIGIPRIIDTISGSIDRVRKLTGINFLRNYRYKEEDV